MGNIVKVKFNGTLEIDADDLAEILEGGEGEAEVKTSKSKSKGDAPTKAEFKAAMDDFKKETSAKDLKALLGEFDYKSVTHVEEDDFAEIMKAAEEALDDEGEEEEEEGEEEEEITADTVKAKIQALTKAAGKEAVTEILEDYDIKSVRSLSKLDQEDLAELYEDVCDAIDEA